MNTSPETTIEVLFDLEPGEANLWSVTAAVPCERALLDAWVLCLGLQDRLALAGSGAELGGDVARAHTFIATSAQALVDACLPAYAGNRAVTRLLLETMRGLDLVVEQLGGAEEAAWAGLKGEEAALLASVAEGAARAVLEARDLVQRGACVSSIAVDRCEALRPVA